MVGWLVGLVWFGFGSVIITSVSGGFAEVQSAISSMRRALVADHGNLMTLTSLFENLCSIRVEHCLLYQIRAFVHPFYAVFSKKLCLNLARQIE